MLGSLTPVQIDLPDAESTIYPIGDLHIGSAEFRTREWEQFLERVKGEKNSYIVLVGDLINNGLKSSVTNCYEETMRPCEQKRLVAKMLEPVKSKILCAVTGNHEARSGKDADDDPVYDIMTKLDIEDRYRKEAAFLIIRVRRGWRGNSNMRPVYTFCVTHGTGGGMYIGSGANRSERFGTAIDGLDCLITGHTHKPLTFPVGKLMIDTHNNCVTQKQFRCVVCTSWMGYGGYPMQKMLTPTAFNPQRIVLSNRGKSMTIIS